MPFVVCYDRRDNEITEIYEFLRLKYNGWGIAYLICVVVKPHDDALPEVVYHYDMVEEDIDHPISGSIPGVRRARRLKNDSEWEYIKILLGSDRCCVGCRTIADGLTEGE